MGERYDARRELGTWTPVTVTPRDDALLVPERSQPIRVTEELRPVAITEPAPGVHVFDLGQNMVGHVRLAVEGERGTEVRLRFAEMVEPDGTIYVENLRAARQQDTYVLRGGGAEVYEPRFTFHGFRYVEVTGLAGEPSRRRSPAASCTPTRRAAAGSNARTSSSTSSGTTSTGASAATSSRSRPTARSATSGSAGSPTPRSSSPPRR